VASVILSDKLACQYDELKEELAKGNRANEREYKLIKKGIDLLSVNPWHGIVVPRCLPIFEYYTKKYGVKNLRKLDVSKSWRLMYTVAKEEVQIIAFVLDLVDHKTYERIGGYNS